MRRHKRLWVSSICGVAVGMVVSLAGCDSAAEPRESAKAPANSRSVFDPSEAYPARDGGDEASTPSSELPSEARPVSDSGTADTETPDSEAIVNVESASSASIEPVVAQRPSEEPASSGLEQAAATISETPATAREDAAVQEDVVAMAASRNPAMPMITDPDADPSQYPGGIVPASPNAEPLPGGPRLLVPERKFRAEGRPRALRVNYDDLDLLRVLNMGDPLPEDVVDQFPDWLTALDGETIRLRGFMYPAYQQEVKAFVLTRDTGACCFGPNPKVYYLVGVKLKEGTTQRYISDRPFDVVGTFHIAPTYIDGQWYQLYKITDATVIE